MPRAGRRVGEKTTRPGVQRAAPPPMLRPAARLPLQLPGERGRGPALAEVTSGPAVCGGAGRAGPNADRAERSGAGGSGGVRAGHGGAAAPLRTAGESRGTAPGTHRRLHRGGSRAPPPPLRRRRAAASTPRGGAAPRYCLRRHPGPAGAAGAEQSGAGGAGPAAIPPARGRGSERRGPGLAAPGLPTTPARGGPAVTETWPRSGSGQLPRGPVPAGALVPQPPAEPRAGEAAAFGNLQRSTRRRLYQRWRPAWI